MTLSYDDILLHQCDGNVWSCGKKCSFEFTFFGNRKEKKL
jgi:hypothetical protein